MRNFPDPASVITRLSLPELEEASEQVAQGRMRIKLLAASEALQGGVEWVVIGDTRIRAPIQHALSGGGTHIGRTTEEQSS